MNTHDDEQHCRETDSNTTEYVLFRSLPSAHRWLSALPHRRALPWLLGRAVASLDHRRVWTEQGKHANSTACHSCDVWSGVDEQWGIPPEGPCFFNSGRGDLPQSKGCILRRGGRGSDPLHFSKEKKLSFPKVEDPRGGC